MQAKEIDTDASLIRCTLGFEDTASVSYPGETVNEISHPSVASYAGN